MSLIPDSANQGEGAAAAAEGPAETAAEARARWSHPTIPTPGNPAGGVAGEAGLRQAASGVLASRLYEERLKQAQLARAESGASMDEAALRVLKQAQLARAESGASMDEAALRVSRIAIHSGAQEFELHSALMLPSRVPNVCSQCVLCSPPPLCPLRLTHLASVGNAAGMSQQSLQLS
ncbi:unnamed protein product [Closterium sp. Naga37s-1]|nr:unnamed protein product [Closterium sp. Naga37s-1]